MIEINDDVDKKIHELRKKFSLINVLICLLSLKNNISFIVVVLIIV